MLYLYAVRGNHFIFTAHEKLVRCQKQKTEAVLNIVLTTIFINLNYNFTNLRQECFKCSFIFIFPPVEIEFLALKIEFPVLKIEFLGLKKHFALREISFRVKSFGKMR